MLEASGDVGQQFGGGGQVEAAREDHDRLQARRALAALEQADLRAVQVAQVGERLLRETGSHAMVAEVPGELLADALHRRDFLAAQTKQPQTVVCIKPSYTRKLRVGVGDIYTSSFLVDKVRTPHDDAVLRA